MRKPRAAFAMTPHLPDVIFPGGLRTRLEGLVDLRDGEPVQHIGPELADVEILITSWGAPRIGSAELEAMPALQANFHAAGTVKEHLDPVVWEHGIRVTTTTVANSRPVAEYTLAMILLAGKGILPPAAPLVSLDMIDAEKQRAEVGNYRRTIGVVSASTVGRIVVELLASLDLEVLLYDPLAGDDDPVFAQAERVGLADLLRRSSIVSVHTPLLPATVGLIGEAELALLAPGATVINTARAPIVDQEALARAVQTRGLRAILDVTEPEPLPPDHILLNLPGVLVTPHVAGALGNELSRFGELVVREVELYVQGGVPAHPVRLHDLATTA